MEYPRVLIINAAPFNVGLSASSFALNNFFRGWPIDNIAQVYASYEQPDFSICSNYWRFPPIRIFQFPGFQVSKNVSSARTISRSKGTSIIRRVSSFIRSDINNDLGSLLDMWPFHITPQFIDWLQEFNPNVVYSWLGSNSIMRLVRFICRKQKILFVPHFLDDWLTNNSRRLWLSYLQSIRFERSLSDLVKYCREGIGISDLMATEYSSRYGIKMNFVANGIEDSLVYDLNKGLFGCNLSNTLYRFSLLGRLEYSRIEMIRIFIKAVQKLNNSLKTIVLSIYSDSDMPSGLLGRHGKLVIQKKAPPADHQLRLLQSETDGLLYLDDFGESSRRYFRLSLSSKIPLYLSLGRPILTIGPIDINNINYLKKCDVGPVVTENNIDIISRAVKQMIDIDIYSRLRIGERAWGIAERLHRNNIERDKLYNILYRNSLASI